MILRPYQDKIINDIKQELRSGKKSVLTVSPTGSGKTAMFATIATGAIQKNNRVLILVHRKEIMEQTVITLHRLGITAGTISAGKKLSDEAIQVAMTGTLVRKLDKVEKPQIIISDEAHHDLFSNQRGQILTKWSDVPRLGFTATPERLDGRGLCEIYESMVLGPQIADLVADGWLSTPVMYAPPQKKEYHITRGDFDLKEQFEAMKERTITGDVIAHYREKLDHKPTVCFCVNIEHCWMMAEAFKSAGYRAAVVYGDMPRSEREAAINGLATGEVEIVCSCDVISEGVDVPVMTGAILLRRTQSLALFLQQAGRALRPVFPQGFDSLNATAQERISAMAKAGKPHAIILDHAGNYPLHGHILALRQWSLDAKPRKERGESLPQVRSCPRCYGVFSGHPAVCPACGYSWIAEETKAKELKFNIVNEALVEVGIHDKNLCTSLAFGTPQQRQKAALRAMYNIYTLDEAKGIARAAGYDDGWAFWAWHHTKHN